MTLLSNEPVWLFFNSILGSLFKPETVLKIIIGFPASVVSYLALRANSNNLILIFLFLFLPQVLNNHIVHLRQGLAVSFFLIGWFSKRYPIKWSFMLLTPFIHASFFFILLFLFLVVILRKLNFAADLRGVVFISYGVFVSFFLGNIAKFLGARQGDSYSFSVGDISGLSFIFWSGVLLLFVLQGRSFLRYNSFVIGSLIFYLSTYFFIEVSARIFESTLIILLLAGLQMSSWRRQAFIFIIILYGLFSYFLRLDEPWIGF